MRPTNDREFPRMLHHADGSHQIVTSWEGQEAALADGWHWRPVIAPVAPEKPKRKGKA